MRPGASPTRMELLRVRRTRAVAGRGHRLLREKLEGLARELVDLARRHRALADRVARELPRVLGGFALAGAQADPGQLELALLAQGVALDLREEDRQVLGVRVPAYRGELRGGGGHSRVAVPPGFDRAAAGLRELLPALLELAGLEQAVRAVARELSRTRRRANALEHVLIPELDRAQKGIAARLEELEREARARLLRLAAREPADPW
ncbi:MAG: V-type ATP synthase subunit D [Deferrisomatales bacterium]